MLSNRFLIFSLISSIWLFGCNPAPKPLPSVCDKSKAFKLATKSLAQAQQHNSAAIQAIGTTPADEIKKNGWWSTFSEWASSTQAYLADLAEDTGISAAVKTTQDLIKKSS